MTEKSFDKERFEEQCRYFDAAYAKVMDDIAQAAAASGRNSQDIRLLAATKTVDPALIAYGVSKGLELIGENKVQELTQKYSDYTLPKENIHFIGHLQTNKVNKVVGKVGMIHSVDSLKLATEISKRSIALDLVTDILLEVNIGGESGKSGVAPESVLDLCAEISALPAVHVCGLMTIPPICENKATVRKFFSNIYALSVDIASKNMDNVNMDVLSMGMSSDFKEAILEGATLVRVGSLLFGKRNYK